jgi:transposase-like protein
MAGRGRTTSQIAEDLANGPSTVRRWLARWRDGGLDGLHIRWPLVGRAPSTTPPAEALLDPLDAEARKALRRLNEAEMIFSDGRSFRALLETGAFADRATGDARAQKH